MRGSRQHRRAIAICGVVLWLLGVEVLPNLHLAAHADDHTHAADGTIVAHHHHHHGDDADHEHFAPSERDEAQLAIEGAPSGHEAAGIAHRATALHQPPPPTTTPIATPHAQPWEHARPHARTTAIERARPTARGPPV